MMTFLLVLVWVSLAMIASICDNATCLNSLSLRIHYYDIIDIMFIFMKFACDIISLIVLGEDLLNQ